MNFKVGNKTYEIIVASDVQRDGLGIELWDRDKDIFLAEIFRHDDKKKFTFHSENFDAPFEVVEKLIQDFEIRVGRQFQEDYSDDE